jgi:predicted lipid-binding transport protein (Tim44 family)
VSRLAPVLATAAALLTAACGGDDGKDVERTVREFVRATDQRDADTFCGELVTDEFLEQSTGATGDKAEEACEQQLTAVAGLRLKLVRIRKVEVDDDRAQATVVLETQGRRQVRLLRLKREDGDWKLAGGRRVASP